MDKILFGALEQGADAWLALFCKQIQFLPETDRRRKAVAYKAIKGYGQGKKSPEKFIALIDKYQGFDTMTTTMLNEFVEKIRVHEHDQKGSRTAMQNVEIYFNFVGRYIPPHFGEVTLTPEEQEAQRKAPRPTA